MIRIEHVSKTYDGSDDTVALIDIHAEINRGEFVTIVGPSGCGKTTLLNLLAGFETPSEGKIYVEDTLITGPSPERAMVFQQPTLLPWMNVLDNITYGLRLKHGKRNIDQQLVRELIGIMGLTGFEKHKVFHLSGGMQQRVAIARALLVSPSVLLMDEPFGALDAMTRQEMQQFLLRTWSQFKPNVIFITHDIEEAILLGTRIWVISPRPGKIVKQFVLEKEQKATFHVSLEFLELKKEIINLLHPNKEMED
ncbi:ABC transporter ATP-binding protein [Cohnella abietis]|uniref:Taurine import ATP-binding protein TauB n=1 Tax=Cohnella abietis TaxID=2507935 RepID=A0A3T1D5G1_9BACL|nr:ABC transporter ATP-binding protein [Cohnella abietis]BBI33353.1 Taurine import ATP-binding protein TauB [Cohnella abietis]